MLYTWDISNIISFMILFAVVVTGEGANEIFLTLM